MYKRNWKERLCVLMLIISLACSNVVFAEQPSSTTETNINVLSDNLSKNPAGSALVNKAPARMIRSGKVSNTYTTEPEITGIKINETSVTVERGKSARFTATVTGTGDVSQAVEWTVAAPLQENPEDIVPPLSSKTQIDANGVLTVGENEQNDVIRVIAFPASTRSIEDSVTVTLTGQKGEPEPVVTSVTINETAETLKPGQSKQFTAQVTGSHPDISQNVTWDVRAPFDSELAGSNHSPLSRDTRIDTDGTLHIGRDEQNDYIKVLAYSEIAETVGDGVWVSIDADGMYYLTVVNGDGSGHYESGSTAAISAAPPDSLVFDKWALTGGSGTIADPSKKTTTFTMGNEPAEVTARFKENPETAVPDPTITPDDDVYAFGDYRNYDLTFSTELPAYPYELKLEFEEDVSGSFELSKNTISGLKKDAPQSVTISIARNPKIHVANLKIYKKIDSHLIEIKSIQLLYQNISAGYYDDKANKVRWKYIVDSEGGRNGLKITSVEPLPDTDLSTPLAINVPQDFYSVEIQEIDSGVFANHDWIGEINFTHANQINRIGEGNFAGLKNLVKLTFISGLEYIGDNCFNDLPALSEISWLNQELEILPENYYLNIGNNCFNNVSISDISLGSAVTSIGSNSFVACEKLQTAHFTNPDTSIGDGSFKDCSNDLRFTGVKNSKAARYAAANKIKFNIPELWQYFSFANSSRDFFKSGEKQNYSFARSEHTALLNNLFALYGGKSYTVYQSLVDRSREPWGGSCYGFAVTEGLYNAGLIGIDWLDGDLADNENNLNEVSYPNSNNQTRSILNYYYLTQFLTDTMRDDMHWGCKSDGNYIYPEIRERWNIILRSLAAEVKENPVMLSYFFDGGGYLAGHAIIVERVKSEQGGIIELVGRDNRLPGDMGGGEVSIIINRDAHNGYGGISLVYNDGYYNINEDMLAFEFTNDFVKFNNKMPLLQAKNNLSPLDKVPINSRVVVDYAAPWSIDINNEKYTKNSEAFPISGDGIEFENFIVSSVLGETNPTAAPMVYSITNKEPVMFTPEKDGNESFNFSYLSQDGYASVRALDSAGVNITPSGEVSAEDLSGNIEISTVASSGALISVKGTANGGENDDFVVSPTNNGAKVTAPAGTYTVEISDTNGSTTTKTIENSTNGGEFEIEKPSGGGGGGGGGGSSAVNQPKVTKTDGGTVSVSSNGKTVTIRPQDGYIVETITINGKVIDKTDENAEFKTDGTVIYNFEKASSDNKVDVTFAKEQAAEQPVEKDDISDNTQAPTLPFTDVSPEDWYYASVNYVFNQKIMQGLSATEFGPHGLTSRGMIATALYRMAGEPETAADNVFTDVAGGSYYEKAIAWANANGIMKGYGNGLFGPDDSVTREQLALVLNQYSSYAGINIPASKEYTEFLDSGDISPWAADALRWAVESGIMSGKGDGILDPGGNASRAEVAAMLARFSSYIK